MNHLVCNIKKSLEEQWRRNHGQLGPDKLREFQNNNGEYSWSHSDSAVQRSIRTACDALSPGGDQKSRWAEKFHTYRNIVGETHFHLKNIEYYNGIHI